MNKPTRICSINGCEKPHLARGMCSMHYTRVRNHGDPHKMLRSPNVGLCEVDGCGQPMRKRQWCATHYAQWKSTGETKLLSHKWGEGGYDSVHQQLRHKRGSAAEHTCVDCGGPAYEWSYSGSCPDELRDDRGVKFSRDLSRYAPRCIRCHRAFDGWRDKVIPHRLQ